MLTTGLEIAACVVLLLAILFVADRDDGAAGTVAKILIVLITLAAVCAALYGLAYWLGFVGPAPAVPRF